MKKLVIIILSLIFVILSACSNQSIKDAQDIVEKNPFFVEPTLSETDRLENISSEEDATRGIVQNKEDDNFVIIGLGETYRYINGYNMLGEVELTIQESYISDNLNYLYEISEDSVKSKELIDYITTQYQKLYTPDGKCNSDTIFLKVKIKNISDKKLKYYISANLYNYDGRDYIRTIADLVGYDCYQKLADLEAALADRNRNFIEIEVGQEIEMVMCVYASNLKNCEKLYLLGNLSYSGDVREASGYLIDLKISNGVKVE